MAGFVGTRGGKTKFRWNKGQLERLIGNGAAVALQKAGLDVRKSVQRQMVGGSTPTGRAPLKRPKLWRVGERDGFDMVAIVRKVPRPDKVSSWAPDAFLRNDIQADYDPQTKSVVIGPSKEPWLNQLHEFGGKVPLYFQMIRPYPIGGFIAADIKLPNKFEKAKQGRDARGRFKRKQVGAYVGYLANEPGSMSVYLGTRSVRGRAYMETGLQAAMKKIPERFRNTIRRGSL